MTEENNKTPFNVGQANLLNIKNLDDICECHGRNSVIELTLEYDGKIWAKGDFLYDGKNEDGAILLHPIKMQEGTIKKSFYVYNQKLIKKGSIGYKGQMLNLYPIYAIKNHLKRLFLR